MNQPRHPRHHNLLKTPYPAIAFSGLIVICSLLSVNNACANAGIGRIAQAQPSTELRTAAMRLANAETPQGRDWQLAGWTEGGQTVVVTSGDKIITQWTDTEVTGFSGCNRYRAQYQKLENQQVKVSPILSTRMGCAVPGLMKQEQHLVSAIQSAHTVKITVQGQLAIQYRTPTGTEGELLFNGMNFNGMNAEPSAIEPSRAQSAQNLDSSAWKLVTWTKASSDYRLASGTEIQTEFNGDRISGSGGCNRFSGTYQHQGEQLSVNNLIMTEMACASSALMQQEGELLSAITGAKTAQVNASGQLEIHYQSEKGETGILRFSRMNLPTVKQDLPSQPGTADAAVVSGTADGVVEQAVPPAVSESSPKAGSTEAKPPKSCR